MLDDVDGIITGIKLHQIDDGTDLDFADMSIPRADFAESNLRGVSFDGANLVGADFAHTDLKSATFQESPDSGNKPALRKARFDGSTCNQTEFQLTNLDGTTFHRASIVDTELWGIDGTNIDFTEASIRKSRLHQSNLDLSIFGGGTIRDSFFTAADLSESDFSDCRIINCDFTDANLSDSRFSGANLDDETEFGSRLLSEYEADKLAEPDCLHQKFDIPSVSDRGFGRETEPITETPPESPFESIPKWPARINHIAGTPFRVWNRHRSRKKVSNTSTDSCDKSLPRQLEALDEATEVYGNLKSAYRDGPYGGKARKYNVRERETERKRRVLSTASIRNSLLKWGMWYGESPGHVLKMVVLMWAVAAIVLFYSGIQTPTETIVFSWQGLFRLDIVDDVLLFSFRRLFTFSNGSYTVSGGSEVLGIGISAIGKILEAMLIFTLGRRAVS
ncbi:Uncharacterized protein YjbI, contains pentapeptide repeats [Haladaptatus litoreus]|uniref:Uncharacterized protein YjbI, contains pentapeptide repeats n=1 Tax=Haladaptatus litoreus TaxID=553468 RepID=A0A1N7EJ42_9EURY|nr:pentapeptide repeat-containing protein [Haladaptatus litoreus]SIR88122.1 Uncharacterized protein YjbI, contains pentapeptide repeats [Haladaptatus litoreus]